MGPTEDSSEELPRHVLAMLEARRRASSLSLFNRLSLRICSDSSCKAPMDGPDRSLLADARLPVCHFPCACSERLCSLPLFAVHCTALIPCISPAP